MSEPKSEMIEAVRVAIMGMLEPKRTPMEKPSIASLEALLNSEDPAPIDIKPDGSIDRIEARTTTAREIATVACRAALSAVAEARPTGRKLVYNKTTKKIEMVQPDGLVVDSFDPPEDCSLSHEHRFERTGGPSEPQR